MKTKTNKDLTKTIKVQECFKYILDSHYTYLCYYGGRGGGKSESIAQMLVLRAYREPRLRILCMRETQNT
ncbi:phage terminase large subunit, partial [Helicobacter pylori]